MFEANNGLIFQQVSLFAGDSYNFSLSASDSQKRAFVATTGFKEQFAALAGRENAEHQQANRFNAKGFFRSVALTSNKPAVGQSYGNQAPAPIDKPNSSENSRNETYRTKGNEPSQQEKAQGHLSLASRSVVLTKADGFHVRFSAAGSGQKSEVSQKMFLSEPAQNISVGKSSFTLPQKSPEARMQSEKLITAGFSKQQQVQAEIAELMWRAGTLRNRSNIRLALRELDTGLQLLADIQGIETGELDDARAAILSLLAQHGLGNYDLRLNGSKFANQVISQKGA